MLAPPIAKCSGMQTFAVLVTGTELALLIAVLWATDFREDAFISTEMQLPGSSLRVLLSIFVVASTAVCMAYVYVRAGRGPNLMGALIAGAASLGGWATLVLTDMQTLGHVIGTLLFAAGTVVYVAIMITVTVNPNSVFLAGCTTAVIFALLFAAFDGTSYKGVAALFEWAALTTNTATLLMFFITHPFENRRKALVELRTLLGSTAA